jgi:hypothetical protein
MTATRTITRWLVWTAPGLTFLLLLSPGAPAPLQAEEAIDWTHDPVLSRALDPQSNGAASILNARNHRIPLFGITPGFLSDPVGLADPNEAPSAAEDPAPDWLQVTAGNDNPFFDLRNPGDPGGVGFYKVLTQMQLFDSPHTGCAIAVQTVTPAGREFDGVEDGPTVVSPALSLFHALDDGTAIQGFVGKNVNVNPRWTSQLHQSVHYGMAVQRPLLPVGPNGDGNFYIFLEALGRYHYEAVANPGPLSNWEVLPGVHWRLAPNWWMSGGLIVPVTTARPDTNHWQITCSFQF